MLRMVGWLVGWTGRAFPVGLAGCHMSVFLSLAATHSVHALNPLNRLTCWLCMLRKVPPMRHSHPDVQWLTAFPKGDQSEKNCGRSCVCVCQSPVNPFCPCECFGCKFLNGFKFHVLSPSNIKNLCKIVKFDVYCKFPQNYKTFKKKRPLWKPLGAVK